MFREKNSLIGIFSQITTCISNNSHTSMGIMLMICEKIPIKLFFSRNISIWSPITPKKNRQTPNLGEKLFLAPPILDRGNFWQNSQKSVKLVY